MKFIKVAVIGVLFIAFLFLSMTVNAYTYNPGDSLFDGNFTGSPFLFGVFRSNNTILPITDSNFSDLNISRIDGNYSQSPKFNIINNTFILYPSTVTFTYYPIQNYNLYDFSFNFNSDKLHYPFKLFN